MNSLQKAPPTWPDIGTLRTDGRLGATFGDIAVSTPNADVMYRPLIDQPASITLNEDFRFGLHDPIAHPQPYHRSSQYLVAMRASTVDGLDHLLFRRVTTSDWIPSPSVQAFTGMGVLDETITVMLVEHGRELIRRFKRVADDAAGKSGPIKLEYLENDKTQRDLWYLSLYHRLVRRPASFDECMFRWVNVQRLHLNLLAYLDYITIFLPRFRNLPQKPLPVDSSRVGCITTVMSTALECFYVGLPVWFVFDASAARPYMYKRYFTESEVQALLQATTIPVRSDQMGASGSEDGLFSLTPAPGAQVLWTGDADDPARYAVMSKVLQRDLPTGRKTAQSQPPVSDPSNSSTLLVSQPGSSSHSPAMSPGALVVSSRKRTHSPDPRPKGPPAKKSRASSPDTSSHRSRWQDVEAAIMPLAMEYWMDIVAEEKITLGANDQDKPTFPGVSLQHSHFAAPDGFIFAIMQKESTQAGAFANYARLRPLIQYRLDSVNDPKAGVQNLHAQIWRTVLGIGVLGSNKKAGRAATKRATAVNSLNKSMSDAQLEVSIDISNLRSVQALWRDGTILIDNGSLPPISVCREILWEMYELNFRSELVLLDAFVFSPKGDDVAASERRMVVLNTISHFNGSVVVEDDDFRSRGFTSPSATERKTALCELVTVMRGWGGGATLPVALDNQTKKLQGLSTVFAEEIVNFTKDVGRHYIKTFYKVFARPPTLPRRLQEES